MGTTSNAIEVIILSDDEDEAPEPYDESSVYIVEPVETDSGETGNIWIYSTQPLVSVVLVLRCKHWPVFQTLLQIPASWKKTWWSHSPVVLRCCRTHATTAPFILLCKNIAKHTYYRKRNSPFNKSSGLSCSVLKIVPLMPPWLVMSSFVISASATSVTSWHHQYVISHFDVPNRISSFQQNQCFFKTLSAVLTLLCIPQCVLWCQVGICHCNSHKRSNYWSNLRDSKMLGNLQPFNLTVSEMDEHLRRAGTTLWSL